MVVLLLIYIKDYSIYDKLREAIEDFIDTGEEATEEAYISPYGDRVFD